MSKVFAIFHESGPPQLFPEAVFGPRLIEAEVLDHVDLDGEPHFRLEMVPNPDCTIPAEAVEISDEDRRAFLEEPGKWRWKDGRRRPVPPPGEEELAAWVAEKARRSLAASDRQMARGAEDLIEVLKRKGILVEEDLPAALREKIAARRDLRAKLAGES